MGLYDNIYAGATVASPVQAYDQTEAPTSSIVSDTVKAKDQSGTRRKSDASRSSTIDVGSSLKPSKSNSDLSKMTEGRPRKPSMRAFQGDDGESLVRVAPEK